MNKQEKQNKFDQMRNRLGQTAIPNTTGLSQVPADRQRLFGSNNIIDRLQKATASDTLENRMREVVQKRKDSIRHAKKVGLMDPNQMHENWAFNEAGELELELI